MMIIMIIMQYSYFILLTVSWIMTRMTQICLVYTSQLSLYLFQERTDSLTTSIYRLSNPLRYVSFNVKGPNGPQAIGPRAGAYLLFL